MSNTFEKGYALLIGVSDQENTADAPALPETATDVIRLKEVLIDPAKCGYQSENVVVLTGTEATLKNILRELKLLSEKTKNQTDSTVLVYFSGHGYLNSETEKYYLVPYDFDLLIPEDTALEDSEFAKKIDQIKAQRLLLIMDSCYAGGTTAGGGQSDGPEGFTVHAANLEAFGVSGAKIVKNKEDGSSSSGSKPGGGNGEEKPDPKKPSRAVLTSSQGHQLSYLHERLGMSVFTYHLIEALNGHGKRAEAGEPTMVNVFDVMSYVGSKVPGTTMELHNANQEPDFGFDGKLFDISMLMGGEGIPEGEEPPSVEQILNINVAGDHNKVAGGDLTDNSTTDNSKTSGGHMIEGVNMGGGDFTIGDHVGGDKFETGDISGHNVQLGGQGNTITEGVSGDVLAQIFQQAYAKVEQWPEDHEDIDREELKETVEKIEQEIQKPEPKESKLKRWIGTLKENAPDILETISATIINPPAGAAVALKKIAGKVGEWFK